MKKFLSILFLFTVAVLPAYSVLTTDQAISADYLEKHGHSDEMSRLVDLQRSQINGTPATFVSSDPEWYSQQPYKFVRQVFMFWDKGLDDGKFAQNKIKYTERYDDL